MSSRPPKGPLDYQVLKKAVNYSVWNLHGGVEQVYPKFIAIELIPRLRPNPVY